MPVVMNVPVHQPLMHEAADASTAAVAIMKTKNHSSSGSMEETS